MNNIVNFAVNYVRGFPQKETCKFLVYLHQVYFGLVMLGIAVLLYLLNAPTWLSITIGQVAGKNAMLGLHQYSKDFLLFILSPAVMLTIVGYGLQKNTQKSFYIKLCLVNIAAFVLLGTNVIWITLVGSLQILPFFLKEKFEDQGKYELSVIAIWLYLLSAAWLVAVY